MTGQATIEDHRVLGALAEYERDAFQAAAVAAVLDCFRTGADRCQGYAPTGAGKTHIATAIWDGLDPPGNILVMVSPTRSVSQAAGKFRDYCRATVPAARTLQVTSDPEGTTDPGQIKAFLADDTSPRRVFVTDASLPRVTEALVKLGLVADLFIVDEAHRNTAVRLADVKAFWAEEAVTKLPAARRFYITATPRSTFGKADPSGRGLRIISQDNAEMFGPVAFDLTFDEAVRRGIVLPVAAYTFDTTDGEIAETFSRASIEQIWHGERMTYREMAAHLAIYKAVTDGLTPPEGTGGEPYRPVRIMVTFNLVSQAEAFVKHHAAIMEALGVPDARAFLYVGTTSREARQVAHRCVRDLTCDGQRLSHAVIAQCGALTESFDLPDLDMTLLAEYSGSTIATQQLIGRVTRLPVRSSKQWASVVTTDVNTRDLDDRPFHSVVGALTGLSESLRHELYQGRGAGTSGGAPPARLGTLDGKPLAEDVTDRVRLALVPGRRLDDWIPEFIDHLRDFHGQYGHADVKSDHVSPDGYPLGKRAEYVRREYGDTARTRTIEETARWREIKTSLENDLAPLGFSWEVRGRGDWIAEFIDHLRQFKADFGHVDVRSDYVSPDGYSLGIRVATVRSNYGDTPRLKSPDIRARLHDELEPLGFRWTVRAAFGREFIDQIKKYIAEYGHADPPAGHVTPDGYPLGVRADYVRAQYGDARREPGDTPQDREETGALRDELNALGFRLRGQKRRRRSQDEFIERLKAYAAENDGNVNPPYWYVTPDRYPLGERAKALRASYRRATKDGGISPAWAETKKELDMLGFLWNTRQNPGREASKGDMTI